MIQDVYKKQRDVLMCLLSAMRKLHPSQTRADDLQRHIVTIKDVVMGDDASIVINTHQKSSNYGIENTKILAQGISGDAADHIISTDETLISLLSEIEGIRRDAENTHKMVSSPYFGRLYHTFTDSP
jgi:DNA helicase IV